MINALKGDIGFVSSQPELPHYVNMFKEGEKSVLTVRLGITGGYVEDFLEKLFILINDNDLRKKMSSNSEFLFRSCYSTDEVYARMVNFLEGLAQSYVADLK